MNKQRIAVVGCGYWGHNLIRNFAELKDLEVAAVCDFDLNALARVKRRYPTMELKQSFQEVLHDSRIHAVAIATPIATHYSFARQALLAGKHVLVEKPLATSSQQVLELIALAEKKGRVLMVDHTFLYTGAVRRIKALVDAGELGELLFFDSVRISLGLVPGEANVLWDLGPHDFSVMNFLCSKDPVSITATGTRHLGASFENMAHVSAVYENNLTAHFHFNWLAPVKVRKTLIGGSKKMIVYDDMEASEKVKVYGKGLAVSHDADSRAKLLTGFQNGDMLAPHLDTGEALRLVARDFSDAIHLGTPPVSDGASGYRVVRMLEAAQLSMEQNGRPVDLRASAIPSRVALVPQLTAALA